MYGSNIIVVLLFSYLVMIDLKKVRDDIEAYKLICQHKNKTIDVE
ncbi:MAG: hypothetical protein WCH65_05245 [bacterium]